MSSVPTKIKSGGVHKPPKPARAELKRERERELVLVPEDPGLGLRVSVPDTYDAPKFVAAPGPPGPPG